MWKFSAEEQTWLSTPLLKQLETKKDPAVSRIFAYQVIKLMDKFKRAPVPSFLRLTKYRDQSLKPRLVPIFS